MGDDELIASLHNTAYTTGAGANCYFQAFIHTLCAQNDDVIKKLDALPSTKHMIDEFNETVQGIHVDNMIELISVARAMHPLEREVIFGTVMRNTFNRLEFQDSDGNMLALSEGAIVNPKHTIPFAHAFGFSLDVYTLSSEAEGMPGELKTDPLIVGDVMFYREHHPLTDNIGELILRLKSRHFEIAGLDSKYVQEHQSKIVPASMGEKNEGRHEAPGARYYEKPSVSEDCAIPHAGVSFDIAVSRTVSALMERDGDHRSLMTVRRGFAP